MKKCYLMMTAFLSIFTIQSHSQNLLDLAVGSLVSPVSNACVVDTAQEVTIQVSNTGVDTVTSVLLNYSVNSGDVVSEYYNDTILPGETIEYTFEDYYDFSTEEEYDVNYWLSIEGDFVSANDSITQTVEVLTQHVLLNVTTGNYGFEVFWSISNSFDDNVLVVLPGTYGSYNSYNHDFCVVDCESYTISVFDTYGDYNGGEFSINALVENGDSLELVSGILAGGSNQESYNFDYCETANIAILNSNLQNGCALSSEENISVLLKNQGAGALDTTFNINYILNGGDVVTETYEGELAPSEEMVFTFSAIEDLSTYGEHTISAWITYFDGDATNDSLLDVTVNFVDGGDVTYNIETFTGSYAEEVSWNITNSSDSTVFSYQGGDEGNNVSVLHAFCAISCETYNIKLEDSYGDGWNGGFIVISEGSNNIFEGTVTNSDNDGYYLNSSFYGCNGLDLSLVSTDFESGCIMTDTEYLSFTVHNLGGETVESFDISYSLDSGLTVVTETVVQEILADSQYVYTFLTPEDFSATGYYNFSAWITLEGDQIPLNDSLFNQQISINGTLPIELQTYIQSIWNDVTWKLTDQSGFVLAQSEQFYPSSYTTYESGSACINPCEAYFFTTFSDYPWIVGWGNSYVEAFIEDSVGQFDSLIFHGTSTVNDLEVIESFYYCDQLDIGVASVDFSSGCTLSGHESVTCEIENAGGGLATNFIINYQLNDGEVVSETFLDSITPGETVTYTFNGSEDLSLSGTYVIDVWVTLNGDVSNSNDSLNFEFSLYNTPVAFITTTFIYGYETSWAIFDSNSQLVHASPPFSSYNQYTDSVCINNCETFEIQMYDAYGDGWNDDGSLQVFLDSVEIFFGDLPAGEYSEQNLLTCLGPDLTIISSSFSSGCLQSETEYISFVVGNPGIDTVSSFNLSYSIDGGEVVTETVTQELLPDSQMVYTFSVPENLSNTGTYQFSAWLYFEEDLVSENDSLNTEVALYGTVPLFVHTNSDSFGSPTWVITTQSMDTIAVSGETPPYETLVNEICIETCDPHNIIMQGIGNNGGGNWSGGSYDILNENGENVATGSYSTTGVDTLDVFSHCVGLDATVALESPSNNRCLFSGSDQVVVQIQNNGTDTIYSLDVSYSVNGGDAVTETFTDTILPSENYSYEFNTITSDFSTAGTYNIDVWVEMVGDIYPDNDTITEELYLDGTVPLTVSTYSSYIPPYWVITNELMDTIMESGILPTYTTTVTPEFCVVDCDEYNIIMSGGSAWNAWISGYYNIITDGGDTIASGSYTEVGVDTLDAFYRCIGVDASVVLEYPLNGGCVLTDAEHVIAQIQNVGTDTIFSIDVNYFVNDGEIVTETVNDTIAPNSNYSYQFDAFSDFSSGGLYYVDIFTTHPEEVYPSNDGSSSTVELYGDFPITMVMDVGGYGYEVSWQLISPTNDTLFAIEAYTYSSNSTYTHDVCIYKCAEYDLELQDDYGDGWNGGVLYVTSSEVSEYVSDTITSGTLTNSDNNGFFSSYNFSYCEHMDAALTGLSSSTSCVFEEGDLLSVEIFNNSNTLAVDSVELVYSLDGSETYIDYIYQLIVPGDVYVHVLENQFNLTNAGEYNFDAWLNINADEDLDNDSLLDFSFTLNINTIPNQQDFDEIASGVLYDFNEGEWLANTNSFEEYGWSSKSGPTNSYPYTGPSSGFGGDGTYLLVEQDSGSVGDLARITSRCYDLMDVVNPTLGFWYHKSGTDQPDLNVYVNVGDSTSWIGVIEGQVQFPGDNPWLFQQFSLSEYSGSIISLVFETVKSSEGSAGDVAVDNVSVIDLPTFEMSSSVVCADSALMEGPADWFTYSWSNCSDCSSSTAYAYETDTITLTAYNEFGFYYAQTFEVQIPQNIELENADYAICIGDSIVLDYSYFEDVEYNWGNGEVGSVIELTPSEDQLMSLQVSNICYSATAEINIIVSSPELNLSVDVTDTIICVGDILTTVVLETSYSNYQWYNSNDNSIVGGFVLIVAEEGSYWVTAEDDNGCVGTSSVINVSIDSCAISIDEFSVADVNLYPNPNNGVFQLYMNGLSGDDFRLDIVDPLGKLVYRKEFNNVWGVFNNEIDLEGFAQGLYLLTITSDEKSISKRFTIQE